MFHSITMVAFIFSMWDGDGVTAQTREDLEQNKQTIEREIRLINQMLQETKKTAEISLNHLVMINNQINSRESLIRTINNEIQLINHRIESLNNNIETLSKELEALKESYAMMVTACLSQS
jgi:murein hydrolase activator